MDNPATDLTQTIGLVERAIDARSGLLTADHQGACRLFSGFFEGSPDLSIDLYASTLLMHNYAEPPDQLNQALPQLQEKLLEKLSWVKTVILKSRSAIDPQDRRGRVTYGGPPDSKICEREIWYAIDLLLNRDASFYLDTRNLRAWIQDHLRGKTVLNAFAYTGSLGVAAWAGGARQVLQLDRNRSFLNLAAASYKLNDFSTDRSGLLAGDFFTETSRMRRFGHSFDCVLIDPPVFSVTQKGKVDLLKEVRRLINKVRPLVNHDGWLVAINNAVFVSGQAYLAELQELATDGCLELAEIIPVPQDYTGYPETVKTRPPVDPAPFNHSTKIAVLRVKKKPTKG